jgi:hypothetical protein
MKRTRDGETHREEAIDHVVTSANYWASDNIHADASFNCPANVERGGAFDMAVEHVNDHHYLLSEKDVAEARRRYDDD